MPDRPTLYLSGWNSRTQGHHGPGPKLSIMVWPGKYVRPDGHAFLLIPTTDEEIADLATLILARRAKEPTPPDVLARYRGSLESRWADYASQWILGPGRLSYVERRTDDREILVPDGASLLCGCSAAHAAIGECHRAWAAPFLVRSGWRVILDGVEVTS